MHQLLLKNLCYKGNNVIFNFYRSGNLYYVVKEKDTENTWQFSIPLSDTGNGTFSAADKAITYMRWIRKAIDNNELTPIK